MTAFFGVCPCCKEIHKLILVRELPPEDRNRLMKGEYSRVVTVLARHAFGPFGSQCSAGSPFLLPPERIVEAPR